MFLCDEGPILETLDFALLIGSTPTFYILICKKQHKVGKVGKSGKGIILFNGGLFHLSILKCICKNSNCKVSKTITGKTNYSGSLYK